MSLLKRKLKVPRVAKLIGFRLLNAGKGRAVCSMQTNKEHENTMGTVHGGILCDLADAAMGFAFETTLPPEAAGATVELKMNFLKPVFVVETLRAFARVLSQGKTLTYVECEVRNGEGRLVAKAASTCKRLSMTLQPKKRRKASK